jgi:hypothetical protein
VSDQAVFLVLEGMTDQELAERVIEWSALCGCTNYEAGSPVAVALAVAWEHATMEQWRRTARSLDRL